MLHVEPGRVSTNSERVIFSLATSSKILTKESKASKAGWNWVLPSRPAKIFSSATFSISERGLAFVRTTFPRYSLESSSIIPEAVTGTATVLCSVYFRTKKAIKATNCSSWIKRPFSSREDQSFSVVVHYNPHIRLFFPDPAAEFIEDSQDLSGSLARLPPYFPPRAGGGRRRNPVPAGGWGGEGRGIPGHN